MKTQLRTMFGASGVVIWLGLALVGCNGLTTTDAARTGLGYSLAAYSGYQGLLAEYAKLPYCEDPAVAPCRDRALYKKLYDADAVAVACAGAAQRSLETTSPDFVTIAACIKTVEDAKFAFAKGASK
jgi:hypothetical protein